jgi:ferredoxin/coenzyme F420-reducing hydrogenase delta subunit
VALIVLSVLKPALGQGAADLATVPQRVELDWFYLFVYPLLYWRSAGEVWAMAGALTVGLLALPLIARAPRIPVAQVDPENCNGCARCFADCPYAAIVMQRPIGAKRGGGRAVVLGDLCASCGVCVGACPSASPFRSGERLVTGIDLPQRPIDDLRENLERALAGMSGAAPRIVAFGCDHGARIESLARPGVATFSLACTAVLPPSFVEYALRNGADGVLVALCGEGECAWRLGARWTIERLARERAPRLRANVPGERLSVVAAGTGDEATVERELARLRTTLAGLPRWRQAGGTPGGRRKLSATMRAS